MAELLRTLRLPRSLVQHSAALAALGKVSEAAKVASSQKVSQRGCKSC